MSSLVGQHFLQVVIPKPDGLFHPQAMAGQIHGVEGKVLPANPCVESLRHVGSNLAESSLFRLGEVPFGTLVVTATDHGTHR